MHPAVLSIATGSAGTHRWRSKNSTDDAGLGVLELRFAVSLPDGDRQVPGLVIGLELNRERIRVVGGVVRVMSFERPSRLEVEEGSSCVRFACWFTLRFD